MHPLVRRCAVALALALPGLAACAQPPAAVLRTPAAGRGAIAVTLRPVPAAARALLADVPQRTAADVKHVEITLYELDGGTPQLRATAERLGDDADKPVIFQALKANTTYRVRARAYKAFGTAAADLISVDADSTIDLAVGEDDRPVAGTLPVKLAATPFAGRTQDETGIGVVAGGYTDGLRGLVTTFAGGATAATIDGTADAAAFHTPSQLAATPNGGIWVASRTGNCIRFVDASRVVTTVAGGTGGHQDTIGYQSAFSARFNQPEGVFAFKSGYGASDTVAYVADTVNHVVRKLERSGNTVQVTTIAGQVSTEGHADGIGAAATFSYPVGIAGYDGHRIYVLDRGSAAGQGRVREIGLSTGLVTTIAGGGADRTSATVASGLGLRLDYPQGIFMSDGTTGDPAIFVADSENNRIVSLDSGSANWPTKRIAGALTSGYVDESAGLARFNRPAGLAYDEDLQLLYVADEGNDRIRRIDCSNVFYITETVAGDTGGFADGFGGSGGAARFGAPFGLALTTGGFLAVADRGNSRIRAVR